MENIPTDARNHVLTFLRPFDRLRWLGVLMRVAKKAKHVARTDLSSPDLSSPDLSFAPEEVLALYTSDEIAPQMDVDLFLWRWMTRHATLRLVIDPVQRVEMRNVERHFTECWTAYGGHLTLGETNTITCLSVKAPAHHQRWNKPNAVGALLEGALGRNEHVLSFGFGDMVW